MSFLAGLWEAAKTIIGPAVGALLGEGVSMVAKKIGSTGSGVVDTIGNTGTMVVSNIGQQGSKFITSKFGAKAGQIAGELGQTLVSSVGNRIKDRACDDERQRIRELEEEVLELKKRNLGN